MSDAITPEDILRMKYSLKKAPVPPKFYLSKETYDKMVGQWTKEVVDRHVKEFNFTIGE